MALKMIRLDRTRTGYKARKTLPADCRNEYARLFGQRFEAWFAAPAKLSHAEAKSRFSAWLSEIENRIAAIRNRNRGVAQDLSPTEARALAGEWYVWFVERHDSADANVAATQDDERL